MWCRECARDIPRARRSGRASTGYLRCVKASIRFAAVFSSAQHPSVLGTAALTRVHHQRAPLERDARQAARYDTNSITAGEHEGPQIDVPRRDALFDASWAGGERESRLSNEIFWIGLQLGAK